MQTPIFSLEFFCSKQIIPPFSRSDDSIGDTGATDLASAMKANQNIKTLILTGLTPLKKIRAPLSQFQILCYLSNIIKTTCVIVVDHDALGFLCNIHKIFTYTLQATRSATGAWPRCQKRSLKPIRWRNLGLAVSFCFSLKFA